MTSEDAGREAFMREAGKLYDEMIARAGPASAKGLRGQRRRVV